MKTKPYKTNNFDTLLSLQQRLRPPEWWGDYPAAADLHEILVQSGPMQRTRLWFDGENLVAYALVDGYNNLLCEIDPRYTLEDEVVAWGETCLREMRRQGETEADATLDGSCRQENTRRMEMMLKHGFQVLPGSSLRYRRSLEAAIPAHTLPPGFTFTNAAALAGTPHLVERIVELHHAAHEVSHMTVEERQSIMDAPDYNPAQDLFIVAPDGRLAGYTTCTIDAETPGVGFTDPVAVHRDFHRLGLGKALITEGLRLLQTAGVKEAQFTTSSENTAMQALVEAMGFDFFESMVWLAKDFGQL